MLEVIFIIASLISLSISALNWRFHFVGATKDQSERFSIFIGLWTITLMLLASIAEKFNL